MSHVVTIQTEVRDEFVVRRVCERLKLPEPVEGRHQLFAREVEGLGVQLPDWRYPLVCELPAGKLHYDTYNGRWGDPQELNRFLQLYATEKATLEARRQGHSVLEQALPDGSIQLTVQWGGAA